MNHQEFAFNTFMERRGMSAEKCELGQLLNAVSSELELTVWGPWVAGGSMIQTLTNQPLNTDVDIFFANEAQYNEAHRRFSNVYIPEVATKGSDTFSVPVLGLSGGTKKVQLIKKKYYGSANLVIADFDLTVCQFCYNGENLICGEFSQSDLAMRLIKFNRLTSPHTTALRVIKYLSRGFKITPADAELLNTAAFEKFTQSNLLINEFYANKEEEEKDTLGYSYVS